MWSHVHVRGPGTVIGDECIVGERTYIAYGVVIGHRVKINAGVYLCTGVTIANGVLVGAGAIFTNDRYPRATSPDLAVLRGSEPDESTWPTTIEEGATIGAGSVIGLRSDGRALCHGRHGCSGDAIGRPVSPRHRSAGASGRGGVARGRTVGAILRRQTTGP